MIETPRLRLRTWTDDDVDAWAAMNADPLVMRYFMEPTPRERSIEQVARMRASLERNRYGWWVLEERERPGFAGVIVADDIPWETPFEPRREIGWRLPARVWQRRYATEAASAVLR